MTVVVIGVRGYAMFKLWLDLVIFVGLLGLAFCYFKLIECAVSFLYDWLFG